jgi:hypothetical protein
MSFIFPPNSKMYLDFTNGIIGIGTTNPTSNLHVVGNLTVSGTTNLSSITFGSGITGILNTASQPNITSVGTLTGLTVTGSGITSFSFEGKELRLEPQIMDSTALYISNGGASVQGDITQTSGTTTLKTTTIDGSLSIVNNLTSNLTITGNILSTGRLNYFTGNVGIGTLLPTANLHVVGPINLISSTGPTGLYMRLGNVGIGTTNPNANLHVQGLSCFTGNVGIGNISNTSNLTIYCNSSNITNESSIHALLINSGTSILDYTRTCMYLGADANGNVSYIQSSRAGANLPLLLNNRGGNVGINTNSARSTLDVVGDIRLSGLLVGPTSAVTFTSSTIGYTVSFTPSSSVAQTTTQISTVGLSGFTLPIGVWHLFGVVQTSNSTGTTNVSYTVTGFSTSSTSFTSTYGCRYTVDNSTRTIGFGLSYSYGYFTHSQYVTMTTSDTLYLLCQPYFSTNALGAAGYVYATRIA